MSVDIIREKLYKLLNEYHLFLYVGSRGIFEKFHGRIIRIYPRTFIVELDNGIYKSFSYSDYLVQTLKIIE